MNYILRIFLLSICIIEFLFGQELFYKEKQSGINLGFGIAAGDNISSNSLYLSYVFSGKLILRGHYGSASQSSKGYEDTKGNSIGGGIGLLLHRKEFPLSTQIGLNYSSIDYNSGYLSNVSANTFSISMSFFRHLNPDKPLNVIPQFYVGYSLASISTQSPYLYSKPNATDKSLSYGFAINIGYKGWSRICPIFGIAVIIGENTTQTAVNFAIAFSKFKQNEDK